MTDMYTAEKRVAFIKSLYCPARQCADETGCSWELILAQAAQETGWGEKILPGTNNVFNIKATSDWQGESRAFNVWEKVNGQKIWINAPFRVYASILDSLRDRQKFLQDNPRYRHAGLYSDDIKGNFVEEAQALKRGGYATDEAYAVKLKQVFDGPTMQRAIAAAKKDGCKGCLPTINVYIRDAARVELANSKVKVSQGNNTCELLADNNGHVQIQAAISGGPVAIEVWSEHDRAWIAIEEKVRPTSPPTAITLIAPTLVIDSVTERHEQPIASDTASTPAHTRSTHTPAASASPRRSKSTHATGEKNAADTDLGNYTIKRGDSLIQIAKAHSTSYLTLARLNGIVSPYHIYPGQIVKVPKPRQASQKAGVFHGADTLPLSPNNAVHALRHRGTTDHPQTDVLSARRAPWMAIAEHEFQAGVRRRGGAHPDRHIQEYFSATSLGRQRSDNLAYCAAFVNWCLTRAGFRGNNSAGARSLSTWGRATHDNKPAYGAIAIVHFPTGGFHVTFVNGKEPGRSNAPRIATLGGNQGHAHEVSHSAVPASWITHYRFPVDYIDHAEDYDLDEASVDSAQMSAASTH
ncbi:glucosaminidase domain-containing protein [Paraburkholderia fungorum]|uniref:glucosaminidase domain-containing protein n=1 Tax=Paraburkholderia fungorum TaxID=134537 RepID=UPI0038BC6218